MPKNKKKTRSKRIPSDVNSPFHLPAMDIGIPSKPHYSFEDKSFPRESFETAVSKLHPIDEVVQTMDPPVETIQKYFFGFAQTAGVLDDMDGMDGMDDMDGMEVMDGMGMGMNNGANNSNKKSNKYLDHLEDLPPYNGPQDDPEQAEGMVGLESIDDQGDDPVAAEDAEKQAAMEAMDAQEAADEEFEQDAAADRE